MPRKPKRSARRSISNHEPYAPKPGPESPLLTMQQAADYLKISITAFYVRYADTFEVVKIGKRRYITKASADKFIAENTRPAKSHPDEAAA